MPKTFVPSATQIQICRNVSTQTKRNISSPNVSNASVSRSSFVVVLPGRAKDTISAKMAIMSTIAACVLISFSERAPLGWVFSGLAP